MRHEKTTERARGKWDGILKRLGIAESFLDGKHGPCPMCDGKDRFHFNDLGGRGTFYCNKCGGGDGMDLAMKFTGQDFPETARQIDEIIDGSIGLKAKKPVVEISDACRTADRKRLWGSGRPITPGSLVDEYLRRRHLDELTYPSCLRFVPNAPDGDGGVRPAMLALVQSHDNASASIHRTFLHGDGTRKAEMASPRKMMPGKCPLGGAVRLGAWTGGVLGIAEGIETAMAAANEFEMPVWAALNANMLLQWVPPAGCAEVAVFGDNDESFTGQAAAFGLAKKLRTQGISVTVHIPPGVGDDWADVWLRRQSRSGGVQPLAIAAE